MRGFGVLVRGLGMLLGIHGVLGALYMIVLAVLFGGGLVGLRRVFVVLGCLGMRLLHFSIFLLAGKYRPTDKLRQ